MTTGEGIFWGLVFVGLIWLYTSTRDRWKWRTIMKWVGVVFLVPIVCFFAYLGWLKWDESRLRVESSLFGVNIGDPMDEVRYRKGKPTTEEKGCRPEKPDCTDKAVWNYSVKDVTYMVSFNEGKVDWINAIAEDSTRSALPSFRGVSNFSTQAEVEKLYGSPTNVSTSADATLRIVSFVKYGVFFTFEQDRMIGIGVIDPSRKPLEFAGASESK